MLSGAYGIPKPADQELATKLAEVYLEHGITPKCSVLYVGVVKGGDVFVAFGRLFIDESGNPIRSHGYHWVVHHGMDSKVSAYKGRNCTYLGSYDLNIAEWWIRKNMEEVV